MKKILLWAAVAALAALAFWPPPRQVHAQAGGLVPNYGWWSQVHQPAATTAASTSKAAAGASVKHVATSATVCISAVAAQADMIFNLRDGATGAGTIVWTARLSQPTVGASLCVASGAINIVGTANTAMTLESASAPATNNFATVSLAGYDTL